MARGNGSTFDGSLPIGKKLNIAMINWGFVDGKSQTRLPWYSWKKPYTMDEPTIWFHEVLRSDGTPYRKAERSEEHTSELQSLMRISYAVFCLKKTKNAHYNLDQHTTLYTHDKPTRVMKVQLHQTSP